MKVLDSNLYVLIQLSIYPSQFSCGLSCSFAPASTLFLWYPTIYSRSICSSRNVLLFLSFTKPQILDSPTSPIFFFPPLHWTHCLEKMPLLIHLQLRGIHLLPMENVLKNCLRTFTPEFYLNSTTQDPTRCLGDGHS